MRQRSLLLPVLVLLCGTTSLVGASSGSSSIGSGSGSEALGAATVACTSASPSIPRSTRRSHSSADALRYPPWNTSPNIDEHGFLLNHYPRIPGEWEKEFKLFRKRRPLHTEVQTPAIIRQVPGDGNCLFHSISTCYAHAINGTHLDLRNPTKLQWLYQNSAKLREQAVRCLEQNNKLLFLQGHEYLTASD